jgi:hypothetical protein
LGDIRRLFFLTLSILAACGGDPDLIDADEPLAETSDELGSRCTWRFAGRLQVRESQTEGTPLDRPLARMDVRVSGSLLNHGGFASWGTTRTDAAGRFSFSDRKSCASRNLRIETRFQGPGLQIEEPGLGDWVTVYETSSKRSAGTLDVGTRRFSLSSSGAMRDFDHVTRATFYYVARTIMDALAARGGLRFDRDVRIKYPARTSKSWADGVSMTAYIDETDRDLHTMVHELMHLWNYQHNQGTTNWLGAVWGDWSTHGFQEEPNVAFHEGFASFAKDALMHELWGWRMPRPSTRWRLAEAGLANPSILQRNDAGVRWGLHMLVAQDVYGFDFGESDDGGRLGNEVDRVATPPGCPRAPNLDVWDVLRVFLPHPAAGWSTEWQVGRDDYGLWRFYQRAADVLPDFGEADRRLYVDLLDARRTDQPQRRCSVR